MNFLPYYYCFALHILFACLLDIISFLPCFFSCFCLLQTLSILFGQFCHLHLTIAIYSTICFKFPLKNSNLVRSLEPNKKKVCSTLIFQIKLLAESTTMSRVPAVISAVNQFYSQLYLKQHQNYSHKQMLMDCMKRFTSNLFLFQIMLVLSNTKMRATASFNMATLYSYKTKAITPIVDTSNLFIFILSFFEISHSFVNWYIFLFSDYVYKLFSKYQKCPQSSNQVIPKVLLVLSSIHVAQKRFTLNWHKLQSKCFQFIKGNYNKSIQI